LSKLARFIEELLLPLIAVGVLVVALADLFGLFSLVPVSRIPILTLLLVSLVLSSLILIQRRLAAIHEQMQHPITKIDLEQVAEEMIERIDPSLRKVFKNDYFLELFEFLRVAIKESKVPVNDTPRMHYYYASTLKCYPRATFFSVHSLAASCFWEDEAIKKATADFIRARGKMKHIIFVKDAQELSSPAVQSMVSRLREIGVEVLFVNSSTIPGDLKKNFFVESNGRIAWEIYENSEHLSATVTTNKKQAIGYCRVFEKLRESKIHK